MDIKDFDRRIQDLLRQFDVQAPHTTLAQAVLNHMMLRQLDQEQRNNVIEQFKIYLELDRKIQGERKEVNP